jgi:uridine kinase
LKQYTDPHDNSSESPAEIRLGSHTIEVRRGTLVSELFDQQLGDNSDTVFAAIVNNRVVSLSAPILRSGSIEPIGHRSIHGSRIYRRHLTMMLYEVFYSNYPKCYIRVGQAISEGYYFEIQGVTVDDNFLKTINKGLTDLVAARRPFVYRRVPVEEARRLFVNKGAANKCDLLSAWPSAHVGIMSVGNFVDLALGPVAPHTGYFNKWKIINLGEDFVLQFPDPGDPEIKRHDGIQPNLYKTLKESRRFSRQLGVAHVADLNAACIDGSIRELVQIAEGRQEKSISEIADEIVGAPERRLTLIAGPSSAGKTTFTKRLSIQLKVGGLKPVSISLDNYYVDRKKTPLDENGEFDFESLGAIDIGLFNEHLRQILDGETVRTPRYNFNRGQRVSQKKWSPVSLGKDGVLIIEGIHGLNDALTPVVPASEKYRVYINALNPLAIDSHNRLHTSDTRLIRRIVRDRHYRGYMAAQTIKSWPSVRRGERQNIFPFQGMSNVIFDSSLIYEFSVLKIFAERYLLEVPRTDPAFAEAYRLRKFISMFVPMLPGDVPQTSLIREFIGGSGFSYK